MNKLVFIVRLQIKLTSLGYLLFSTIVPTEEKNAETYSVQENPVFCRRYTHYTSKIQTSQILKSVVTSVSFIYQFILFKRNNELILIK